LSEFVVDIFQLAIYSVFRVCFCLSHPTFMYLPLCMVNKTKLVVTCITWKIYNVPVSKGPVTLAHLTTKDHHQTENPRLSESSLSHSPIIIWCSNDLLVPEVGGDHRLVVCTSVIGPLQNKLFNDMYFSMHFPIYGRPKGTSSMTPV
jgi:hypothetical protein